MASKVETFVGPLTGPQVALLREMVSKVSVPLSSARDLVALDEKLTQAEEDLSKSDG
jgi:hypothetical protein